MVQQIDSLHRECFTDDGIFIVMSLYTKTRLDFFVFNTVDLPSVGKMIFASEEQDAMLSMEEGSHIFGSKFLLTYNVAS